MKSRNENAELEVRRVVPASPEQVFDAWTTPAALRSWWGPPGGSCTMAEVDLQVGGRYRIVNLLSDSSTVIISGEFLDVVRPDCVSYTWTTDPDAQPVEHVTVRFKEHSDGTEVVVSHLRISGERLQEHRAGWDACLSGLVAHLTGGSEAS